MSENKPPVNPSPRKVLIHHSSSPMKALPTASPFINLEPSLTSSPLSPRKILKSLNHQIVAPSASRALFSPKKSSKFNVLPNGKTSARSLNFKSPNKVYDCKIMIKFDDVNWIELDTKAAKIDFDPEIKPTVIVGKKHGFLWMKEKSMIFSFGDNTHGQLGTHSETLESINTLYPIVSPVNTKDICILETFTAIITQEGSLYISGLFMNEKKFWEKIEFKEKIMAISGQDNVLLTLCESGILYSWGNLGNKRITRSADTTIPTLINITERIDKKCRQVKFDRFMQSTELCVMDRTNQIWNLKDGIWKKARSAVEDSVEKVKFLASMRISRFAVTFMRVCRHGSKTERPIGGPANVGKSPIKIGNGVSIEPTISQVPVDIDQLKISQLLIAEGFTKEQADALILLISQAVGESMNNMIQSLALKNDQQLVMQHNLAQFEKLQSDINDLGQKDFAILKSELEKIMSETEALKTSVREDLAKAHGSVRLDISLEKARIKSEAAVLEDDIALAEARVEKELKSIADRIDNINKSTRSQMMKILIGCFGLYTLYKSGTWAFKFYKSRDHPQSVH